MPASFNFSAATRKHLRWVFPALLLVGLVILTALKINGSSIGVYSIINGETDANMLVGQPRGVRSDEWLVNTQMIIAQSQNGYQRINTNIAGGQDMSLIGDAPYKEWSAVFKPQNFSFFVLPLEYAFAFKWWVIGVALAMAAYFFCLELFPKKIGLAVLFSALIVCTPMMVWWYSPGIILCVAYSLGLALLAIRLFKATTSKARLVYSLSLAYLATCFALILYPPFQIPCLILVAIFSAGWWLENTPVKTRMKNLRRLLPYLLLAVVLASALVATFLYSRRQVLDTVNHTVYPGRRVELSGGVDPVLALSSFLSPNLQYDAQAASGYFANQSEASNFIFIAPFLLLPSLYLIIKARRRGKTLWGLILTNLALLGFAARMYIHTPGLEPLYRLLLLDKVPSVRLLLAIGFAGLLQLLLLVQALDDQKLSSKEKWLLSLVGGLSSLVVMALIGKYSIDHFPMFISSFAKVVVLALWLAAAVFMILQKRFNLGLALIVAFSVVSVYKVHPIYKGLNSITNSSLMDTIEAYPSEGNWVVLDNRLLINFPIMAGKHSLNSVELYPQLGQWQQLDPARQYETVYNRYAHVVFSDDPAVSTPFKLQHADTFLVKFEPCEPFLQARAKYVLASAPVEQPCTRLDKVIEYPAQNYYIYQLIAP